jgi:glycosyltransferase involved in cell wall biosynthesis
MNIFSMCLVKDEADVIAQTLRAACEWSERIYIFDNGSRDGTWEIVLDLAKERPQIYPDRQDSTPYSPDLRRLLFDAHGHETASGDWWCSLDADEFYIDDPRVFLASVPARFDEVWAASFEYYFTDKDAERYEREPELYGDDVPVDRKLHYYANNWSEPRFFRYRNRLRWPTGAWPERLGPAYPKRIRLKHYQYRSPHQMQKRLDTRVEAMARGRFLHEMLPQWNDAVPSFRTADFSASDLRHVPRSWRDRVVDSSLLIEDRPGGEYLVNESALPPIPRARPRWVSWIGRKAEPLRRRLRRATS